MTTMTRTPLALALIGALLSACATRPPADPQGEVGSRIAAVDHEPARPRRLGRAAVERDLLASRVSDANRDAFS